MRRPMAGRQGGQVARHPDQGVQGQSREQAGMASGGETGVGNGRDREGEGVADASERTCSDGADLHEVGTPRARK